MSNSTIDSSSSQSLFQQLATLYRSTRQSLSSSQSGSGFGQIVNQLQGLATSDPSQFQQQTADIASQLKTVAGQTSGLEARLFQNLANQFQQASQTGQVPKLGASHHGRHHEQGSTVTSNTAAASTSTSQIAQNADGTYGPENAVDSRTAAIQAAAFGVGFGQTFQIPGGGTGEVV